MDEFLDNLNHNRDYYSRSKIIELIREQYRLLHDNIIEEPDWDNMLIQELGFSVRTLSCLMIANVGYVGELLSMKVADLIKYRGFGKKSISEIKEVLGELNLKLDE